MDTITAIPELREEIEHPNKSFTWPDGAVLLLIDLYREKEAEFKNGLKRHNVIWKEIAAQLQQCNYAVNGLQCSTKFAGLRRTYKNIKDQNNKSGNAYSSWAFYSAIDSLIGDRAYMQPPAVACSEGLELITPITQPGSSSSSSMVGSQSTPIKKRRVETILESHIAELKQERELRKIQRDEERRAAEERKEARHRERKQERERMHSENIEIQKSLLKVLETLANK
ncbi:uncharacterized protein LOC143213341 isoform X1 [Lasioglossum baleicum]|uniref:uncharacterized protein LOC143210547 isoform X1 n=1 Tax=Lasioglossum baleicum TaxID=434251 RepID=UPI003FCC2E99